MRSTLIIRSAVLWLAAGSLCAFAEDADPQGRLAFWDAEFVASPPPHCRLTTYAYDASNEFTNVSFSIWPRSPLAMDRELRRWDRGTLRVEVSGEPTSWSTPLDAREFRIEPGDVDRILERLAGGGRLTLTSLPEKGFSQRYVATTRGSSAAIAMFKACGDMLRQRLPPEDFGTERPLAARSFAGGCGLVRSYQIDRAALTVSILARADGGEVNVTHAVIVSMPSPKPQPADSQRKGLDIHMRKKPFVVGLQDLYGGQIEADERASSPLTLQQLDALEREFVAGGKRKVTLSVKGEGKRRETFGGKLAEVPAAMFRACRQSLAAARAERG